MKIKAFAKINLTLDILGKRPDGYHELDMIMQTVDLYDEIDINLNNSGKINVTSSDNSLGGENDITYKAANAFLNLAGIGTGVDIKIQKFIPLAAGLGGGSSDAATVVTALNVLTGNKFTKKQLEEICLTLGADVPYFLYGGTAAVCGIGEKIKLLSRLPDCRIVIAKSGKKSSTGEIYRKIDQASYLEHPDNKKAAEMLENNDLRGFCKELKNVFSVVWDTKTVEKIMNENGALATVLSGSGPSFFGIFDEQSNSEKAFNRLKNEKIEAYLCRPVNAPNMIIE